jgi:CheY-like chemotaxis protein
MMQGETGSASTLLICDDDEDDRRLTKQAMERAHIGNALRFVEDGEQLMDYLYRRGEYGGERDQSPRPALILLDLNMPRMNGHEALQAIKSDKFLHDIPVIMLSTSQLQGDITHAYELGANSFITKPGSFSDLVNAMQALGQYWLQTCELPANPE